MPGLFFASGVSCPAAPWRALQLRNADPGSWASSPCKGDLCGGGLRDIHRGLGIGLRGWGRVLIPWWIATAGSTHLRRGLIPCVRMLPSTDTKGNVYQYNEHFISWLTIDNSSRRGIIRPTDRRFLNFFINLKSFEIQFIVYGCGYLLPLSTVPPTWWSTYPSYRFMIDEFCSHPTSSGQWYHTYTIRNQMATGW